MKPLKIPCLFHTDETKRLQEMEIKTTVEDYEERPVYFYSINCIYPGVQDTKTKVIEITIISTGAEIYETLLKIDEVLELIKNWNEQGRN